MNYVLAVKSPVYGKQGAFLAYQFAQALLEKGHAISQIFFFQDGVSNGMAWFILPMMNLISRKLGKPFQRNIIFLCIYV